jgi:hypothetical protein
VRSQGIHAACAAVVAAVLAGETASAQGSCLRADSTSQRVSGNLIRQGSNFILRADGPVCLRGADPEDNKTGVRTVHLYSNSAAVERQLSRSVGRYLEVVGRPFGAIVGRVRRPAHASRRFKTIDEFVPPKPKPFESTQPIRALSIRCRTIGMSAKAGSSSSMLALSTMKPLFIISSE